MLKRKLQQIKNVKQVIWADTMQTDQELCNDKKKALKNDDDDENNIGFISATSDASSERRSYSFKAIQMTLAWQQNKS